MPQVEHIGLRCLRGRRGMWSGEEIGRLKEVSDLITGSVGARDLSRLLNESFNKTTLLLEEC